MSEYPQPKWAVQQIRRASGLVEDICHCGVGHPNRDWLADHVAQAERFCLGIHGCCGCCAARSEPLVPNP